MIESDIQRAIDRSIQEHEDQLAAIFGAFTHSEPSAEERPLPARRPPVVASEAQACLASQLQPYAGAIDRAWQAFYDARREEEKHRQEREDREALRSMFAGMFTSEDRRTLRRIETAKANRRRRSRKRRP